MQEIFNENIHIIIYVYDVCAVSPPFPKEGQGWFVISIELHYYIYECTFKSMVFKIRIKSESDNGVAPQGQQALSPRQSVAAPWVYKVRMTIVLKGQKR